MVGRKDSEKVRIHRQENGEKSKDSNICLCVFSYLEVSFVAILSPILAHQDPVSTSYAVE